MKFFDFREIADKGSCIDFVIHEYGVEMKHGRCRAAWRGGDNNEMVAVEKTKYYDFKTKKGGGLIQLCAEAKFGGDIQQAQEWLGEWLHLEPRSCTQKRKPTYFRLHALLESGYKEVKRYVYTDEEGRPAHTTIRLEKPGFKKEFVQCSDTSDTLDGVRTYLYNLVDVIDSDQVVIAEGEKDAETLIEWGFCGTTAPMGALKWDDRYTSYLAGKDIVICRDNDEPGLAHASLLVDKLLDHVKSIKVLCEWRTKDLTEWRDIEGGDGLRLAEIIKAAPLTTDRNFDDENEKILKAKEANETCFSNIVREEIEVNGKRQTSDTAVPIGTLVENLHTRFLGFPCKLGERSLFDHDRDSGRIVPIDTASSLFAWIQLKSGKPCVWNTRKDDVVSKAELYEACISLATRYETTSLAPDWPRRDNVYYAYREKCVPTKGHHAFETLLEFFCPANDVSKALLRVFFAAPLYYKWGVQRPCWIIDSRDGPGVGKTTLVELLSLLYRCAPIKTNAIQLARDYDELIKKLISSSGRASRVLLLDNVIGEFKNENFAELVTGFAVSGKRPYGHGEESRPNDLTCCITVNNATVSDEIASRSFILLMKRPPVSMNSWKVSVISYIESHRWEIFGDIIDILDHAKTWDIPTSTRVPEFERDVMMPMCGDINVYSTAIAGLMNQREDANVDMDLAKQVEEIISFRLDGLNVHHSTAVAFLRTEVLAEWLKDIGVTVSKVREMAATKLITCISSDPYDRVFPRNNSTKLPRRRGLMWIGDEVTTENFHAVAVVGKVQAGAFGVVGYVIGDPSVEKKLAPPTEPVILEGAKRAQLSSPVQRNLFSASEEQSERKQIAPPKLPGKTLRRKHDPIFDDFPVGPPGVDLEPLTQPKTP